MNRRMRKPTICICENKGADQLRGYREADQRLCFRYTDSTIHLLLNPKFPASSHLLCLYRSVCVGPVQKLHCWFSQVAAQMRNVKLPWLSLDKWCNYYHYFLYCGLMSLSTTFQSCRDRATASWVLTSTLWCL